jgi:hypothetical protein
MGGTKLPHGDPSCTPTTRPREATTGTANGKIGTRPPAQPTTHACGKTTIHVISTGVQVEGKRSTPPGPPSKPNPTAVPSDAAIAAACRIEYKPYLVGRGEAARRGRHQEVRGTLRNTSAALAGHLGRAGGLWGRRWRAGAGGGGGAGRGCGRCGTCSRGGGHGGGPTQRQQGHGQRGGQLPPARRPHVSSHSKNLPLRARPFVHTPCGVRFSLRAPCTRGVTTSQGVPPCCMRVPGMGVPGRRALARWATHPRPVACLAFQPLSAWQFVLAPSLRPASALRPPPHLPQARKAR